jgi:thiamine kinase-like enzyme
MSGEIADQSWREVEAIPFWTGSIRIWPLEGGTTNRNFGVQQADGQRFAVRLGQDKPEHGVMRFNEQAAARAAARAGVSPKIFYTAPGVMVMRLLPGRSLTPQEIQQPENLPRVAALLRRCHTAMASYLQGPLLAFWVFHVNRSYLAGLAKSRSRFATQVEALHEVNAMLEARIGKVDITFCHNDLLPGNLFDDGVRLWLLDWDYAGFNTPMFDLANLASNNYFDTATEEALLHAYYGRPLAADERNAFNVFKCASLLREALWNAVSELTSELNVDYARAAEDYLHRLESARAVLG